MSGVDVLISRSLQSIVKENLGDRTYEKIEKRLFSGHGIGFTEATEDFQRLDSLLREFFGRGAEGLERQILKNIVVLEVP
jgi:type IV secretory pathway VirD2 relaxase